MRLLFRAASVAAIALSCFALGGIAEAQTRGPEARIAIMQHDVLHPDTEESGVDVELQLIGSPLGHIPLLGTPRPYVSASGNSDGETNFASVGLAFDRRFTDRLTGEIQFGYAVHDGDLDSTDAETQSAKLQLGSRDLFRTALGLDYRVSDNWAVGVQWDHLSHGQIIGDGYNQGIDAAGVRVSRRF